MQRFRVGFASSFQIITKFLPKNDSPIAKRLLLERLNKNLKHFLGPRGPLVLPSVGPSVPSRPSRKKNLDHYIQAYMPYES